MSCCAPSRASIRRARPASSASSRPCWPVRTRRGEAHGALTPERVLFDATGRAMLAPPPAADASGLAPWPTYLAPEQIDGRAADPRSDVYVLGLLGWEMLAGQAPWAGESLYAVVLKQREQDLPRLSTLQPGLPRTLVLAIEGALHKHPGDRWRDASEMLAQFSAGDAGVATADRPVERRAPVPTAPVDVPTPAPRIVPSVEPDVAAPRSTASLAPPPRPADRVPPPSVEVPRRRSRMRPLALIALAIAVLGAGAAGVAVVQGRDEKGSTAAWLDSIAPGAAAGEVVAESALIAEAGRTQSASRRDSLQRRAAQLAAARRDSVARARRAAADSAAAAEPAVSDPSAAEPDVPTPTPEPPPPDVTPAAARGASADCATAGADAQRRCLLALLARGDAGLTRAYAARIASLRRSAGTAVGEPDPPAVQALRARQRAWLVERDVECQRRGAGREGTLWAPSRAQCLIALGEQRAAALGDGT